MARKKKRYSLRKLNITLILCLIIIAIPFGVLGYILLSARQDSHVPILGNRFTGQLNPAITEEDLTNVKNTVSAIEGVESVSAETMVATTRVYVDVTDTLTEEEISALAASVYGSVVYVLPAETYFTNTETVEMYDLEILVYNNLEFTSETEIPFVMVGVTKNAAMEEPLVQVLSKALNPTAAQQALDNVEARKQREEERRKAEEEARQQEEQGEGSSEEGSSEEGSSAEGEGSEGGSSEEGGTPEQNP